MRYAEIRHERALKRKRREERIARAKRAEREVAKHRVNSKWFRYLSENDIFPKVRGSRMENVRIIDLKVDNIVQFQATFKGVTAMQTAIVNRVYAKEILLKQFGTQRLRMQVVINSHLQIMMTL